MAYVILAFGSIYSLYWLLTFLFSVRSKGERSVLIPLVFLISFLAIAGFGMMKLQEAFANPEKLTLENYKALKEGSTPEEVMKGLGDLSPLKMVMMSKEKRLRYDLTTNGIKMPPSVRNRLGVGKYKAERDDSALPFTVLGEPSRILSKPPRVKKDEEPPHLLGLSATERQNGVKGLTLRFFVPDDAKYLEMKKQRSEETAALKEANKEVDFDPIIVPAVAGKEWVFTEGKDWTYEPDETTEHVSEKLCGVIDKNADWTCIFKYGEEKKVCETACKEFDKSKVSDTYEYKWVAFYWELGQEVCSERKARCPEDAYNKCVQECINLEVESYPYNFLVRPINEDFLGAAGNQLRAQVGTGPNLTLQLAGLSSGSASSFRGGADAAQLQYWFEEDPILDDDFNTTGRLVVAGYSKGKLVALGQNGLNITENEEPLLYKSGSN